MSVRSKPNREGEAPVEPERDGNELPEGWTNARLGQLGTYINGRAFKPTEWEKSGLQIIRIQNLNDKEASFNFTTGVIEEKYRVRRGDLLIAWSASLGAFIWDGDDAWLNQHIFRVEPNNQVVTKGFLLYAVKQAFADLYDKAHGSGMVHVTKPVFEAHQVPLPPLAEQRRIVGKLELLLRKVSSSQQRLSRVPRLLKRFRQSVLAAACSGKLTADWREENDDVETAVELLSRLQVERRTMRSKSSQGRKYHEPEPLDGEDLAAIPDSWIWTNFDHCAHEITVGHVGPMKDRYVDSGVTFLRSQNVRPLRFDPAGLVYIPKGFQAELTKSKLVGGEILVVRSGANTGDCCVFPRGMAEANCSDLVITRPLSGLCPEYGAMYVASPIGQAAIGLQQTGIAQPHFNIGAMKVKPFPLPPLSEQQEIVRRVEKLFAFADQIEARLKQAQTHVDRITQSLLAKAFRGELVPTAHALATAEGRDYETASDLLERVTAAKKSQDMKPPKDKRSRRPKATSAK